MAELLMSEEERVQRANVLKDEGNALLSRAKYDKAAEKYTEAIALHPTAIYYSNRAQAMIKMESYGSAIADANEALKLDAKYIKAYYRRGSANYALGKWKMALNDFKSVLKIVPGDADAQAKYKACDKIVKAEAFAKAIEADDPAQANVIDVNSIEVEETYKGPRLEWTSEHGPHLSVDFVKDVMAHFREEKLLHRKYVIQILLMAIEYFKQLPTLVRLSLPRDDANRVHGSLTVCGDTHGQYYDLLNIFATNQLPTDNNLYLFNGDYVDRGSFSFETVFVLLCWKLALPHGMHLLRGNHETKNMNKIYGFCGEIKHKYDDHVMNLFSSLFQSLPLAAVIEDKVFVTHGGLSTQNEGCVSLSEIEEIHRFREPPESGLMSDLLWSDPQAQMGRAPSKRGLGFSFGPDYTKRFLEHNNLKFVIRSHEVRDAGYEEEHGGKCITVFSAPNYCDQMANKGAFIRFTSAEMTPSFHQFDAVPHPNIPPMRYAGNMFSL